MPETEAKLLPEDRLIQPATLRWLYTILGFSLAYAIVRYHVAGDVPWARFPLFILNKATSLAAVLFVASSYLIGKVITVHDDDKRLRLVVVKFCGLMGFSLASIHAFMAVCLLRPAYFAKYFDEAGMLSWRGELAMTVGIVALFFLSSPAITTLPLMAKSLGGWRWKRSQRMGYVALLLTFAHLVVLGYSGWLAPQKWPWGIPSISLLAAVAAAVPLMVKRRQAAARATRASSP